MKVNFLNFFLHLVLIGTSLFFCSCASSGLSREAALGADQLHASADNLLDSPNSSIAQAYQNSSQAAKGAMIGGAAGAITGGTTSLGWALAGLAGGAFFGGAVGAYVDARTTIADKLQNRNVKVIVLGDQIMLVLPSVDLFYGTTPNLRPQAYSTLDLVATLISSYTNILVKVASYTTMAGPDRINLAVSKLQSDSVVKYLWTRGLDTRLIVAEGEGATRLVEKDSMDTLDTANYRVEITLEKLPI